ncbi:MAG TPA: tyrosine-type recombinase/integrase, partial [Burkholderiales bacterium]|nr:tyrosine-type recombinase/integrase [Burkholderiales bacterium]
MRSRSHGPALSHEYLDALKHQRRLSPATLSNYGRALGVLHELMGKRPLDSLEAAEVRRYVALLHGRGLSPRSLALVLSAWRGCYRWLARHRGFQSNPVLGIRAPKAARPLPKALSVEAAQRLLEGSDDRSPLALQDAAMFELLYSSGLRVAELVALDLDDQPASGEVTVTGKGSKTRTVPVGAKARDALKAWLEVRAQLALP